ncbi:mechanosensitive ion channel family protein [Amorphus sp. MBR-141]
MMTGSGRGLRVVLTGLILAVAFSFASLGGASSAHAQAAALLAAKNAGKSAEEPSSTATSDGLSSGLQAVVKQAEKAGAQVIVIAPAGSASAPAETPTESAGRLKQRLVAITVRVEERVKELVAKFPLLPGHIDSTLRSATPDQSLHWLGMAALLVGITILAGALVYRVVIGWFRSHLLRLYPAVPVTRGEKIGYLLTRGVLMLIAVACFAFVGLVVGVSVTNSGGPVRITNMVVISAVALGLVARTIFKTILCPDRVAYRPFRFDDHTASSLFSRLMIGVWISLAVLALAEWMRGMGMDIDAFKLVYMLSGLVAVIILSGITLAYRREVAGAILAHEPGRPLSVPRRVIAQIWYVVVLVYLWAAWIVGSVRRLLDIDSGGALIAGPLVAMVLALILYSILLIFIDHMFPLPEKSERLVVDDDAPVQAHSLGAAAAGPEDYVPFDEDDDYADDAPLRARVVGKPAFKRLFEHGAAIVSVVVCAVLILHLWGLPIAAEGNLLARSLGTFVVLFLAYMAYEAVKLWVDGKIAAEQAQFQVHGDGDSEMGHGGSTRLATLLPLFRNFLLITIATMAIMVALAGIGVNIAPLFAGAGVVGLAVGFGSQALIKDIFSGAFFLIDDAFRKGEYIDLGGVKGVVEKISIRSFQLRHQNGPLHTVPFGEIKRLTNYSRDWVIMKLPLRLTYDTDPEKVRKLIKKVGQDLLADPDIGHMFLDPLKSQGVYQMEDSAMIIRVKFMTKPGDQFLVRKRVYAEIRDLFAREDIHFAHREVTVRIVDQDGNEVDDNDENSDRRKQAAGAAARRLLDQETEALAKPAGEDPSSAR